MRFLTRPKRGARQNGDPHRKGVRVLSERCALSASLILNLRFSGYLIGFLRCKSPMRYLNAD